MSFSLTFICKYTYLNRDYFAKFAFDLKLSYMKQVSQKLISFKVDKDVLSSLDSIVSLCDGRLVDNKPVRVNRNKFINLALSFAVEAVQYQLEVLSSKHKDNIMPNFI